MIHDNMPNRVFKISELTRLIASQLVLISQKSTVNLACACRCLEEPVLSTLWETQSVLHTLLEVLPEETWDFEYLEKHVVCDLDLLSEESNAQAFGCVSLGSWGIQHQRIGTGSRDTRLGCVKSAWMILWPPARTPSTNYASIHLPVDGFRRWKIYIGSSPNPIFPMPTCSFLPI